MNKLINSFSKSSSLFSGGRGIYYYWFLQFHVSCLESNRHESAANSSGIRASDGQRWPAPSPTTSFVNSDAVCHSTGLHKSSHRDKRSSHTAPQARQEVANPFLPGSLSLLSLWLSWTQPTEMCQPVLMLAALYSLGLF